MVHRDGAKSPSIACYSAAKRGQYIIHFKNENTDETKKALFSAYSADFYPAGNTCKERRLRGCLENDVIYRIAGE